MNKQVEKYSGLITENLNFKHRDQGKQVLNKMCKQRQKTHAQEETYSTFLKVNKKQIKCLSNKTLTEDQINLLAKGLKFNEINTSDRTQPDLATTLVWL